MYKEKFSCLLYADDLVLISENENGLQCCLNKLTEYCKNWNLSINEEKSKVIIFNKSGRKINRKFNIGNQTLETVNKYTYLGIEISSNGNFNGAIKQLCSKAKKALGRLKRILYSVQTDVRLYLDLFDKLIAPIFLYGCEIWGAYVIPPSPCISPDDITLYFKVEFERVYVNYLKYVLGVNTKACNIAVLSEVGKYPYSLEVLTRVCKNWYRMENVNPESLLHDVYRCN